MRILCIGAALMTFALPATARDLVVATNAERDAGFTDLADCQKALGVPPQLAGKAGTKAAPVQGGSLFNRAAGNLSRCALVQGEYLIVVYPKGSPAAAD